MPIKVGTVSIFTTFDFTVLLSLQNKGHAKIKGFTVICYGIFAMADKYHISRAHSFPRAAEFRAEPRNLAVAVEFPCFRGI